MDSFLLTTLLFSLILSATSFTFDTDCYTANGEDYRGSQNHTSLHGDVVCLFWSETLQLPYNTQKYPNGEGGLGTHNFCRNPDGDVRPWCYISDHEDGIYWKYCDIPTCQMPGNLGCFKDTGNPPTLPGSSETSNKLTIQSCINYCRKKRYKLAGTEAGYACFCGNELDEHLHGRANSSECNHACFGDHTQPCGGDGHVAVFDTRVGACGGNYSARSATLYSPDYPERYGPNRVCHWSVRVPGATAVLFHWSFFHAADPTDTLELLDGQTGLVVARYDGRDQLWGVVNASRDHVVNVTSDHVVVHFHSGRATQGKGFAVQYQVIEGPDTLPPEGEGQGQDGGGADSTVPQPEEVTQKSKASLIEWSVVTSSPNRADYSPPEWTVYALAALLSVTVIAMVAKFLLHVVFKSPANPLIGQPESCGEGLSPEPWVISYRSSTISFFKKKLKGRQGDLSPLMTQ